MATSVQLGATHAHVTYEWSGNTGINGWSDQTLPVVDVSCRRDRAEVYIFGFPFISHVVAADNFSEAYAEYVDTIADCIMIDDETLKDYVVGTDSDGNPEYSEVDWTSGGEPVDTTYVGAQQIDLKAITWLYRPVVA